jgi:hypothetical protein
MNRTIIGTYTFLFLVIHRRFQVVIDVMHMRTQAYPVILVVHVRMIVFIVGLNRNKLVFLSFSSSTTKTI